MNRRDLYSECNVVGAPNEVFAEQCCNHCINPECTRSFFGKTKFDQRVGTWHDRLFANVPRMVPSDPRFGQISAQKFVLFNAPLTVGPSWVDPRDLSDQVPASAPEAVPPAPVQQPEVVAEAVVVEKPALVIEKPAEIAVVEPAPKPSVGRLPQGLALTNTPVQQGQMLRPPVSKPAAWDAPVPTTDTQGLPVVPSGARVKLGSV